MVVSTAQCVGAEHAVCSGSSRCGRETGMLSEHCSLRGQAAPQELPGGQSNETGFGIGTLDANADTTMATNQGPCRW